MLYGIYEFILINTVGECLAQASIYRLMKAGYFNNNFIVSIPRSHLRLMIIIA